MPTSNPVTRFTCVVTVQVSGEDPIPAWIDGPMVGPSHMTLRYRKVGNDPWGHIGSVISGGKIKKDGTPGQVFMDCHTYDGSHYPEWVRAAIAEHMPTV